MPPKPTSSSDKSRPRTFQLVQAVRSESNHAFHNTHQVSNHSVAGQTNLSHGATEGRSSDMADEQSYSKKHFEIGEYGFPDDGYDYSQHFRPIGGGGGVYMDAITRMPKPEAVASSSSHNTAKHKKVFKEMIVMKDTIADDEEKSHVGLESWQNPEDIRKKTKAIDEIKRDRKYHQELDEVLATLDSDRELNIDITQTNNEKVTAFQDNSLEETASHTSDFLEDDFVAIANRASMPSSPKEERLDGVIEAYREPRALDEQFEKFMQGFEMDDTDGEEQEEMRMQVLGTNEEEEFAAAMAEMDYRNSSEDEDFVKDLRNLQVEAASGDEDGEKHSSNRDENPIRVIDDERTRRLEFRRIAEAEFEYGMTGMLESQQRVSADSAFAAVDGLEGARSAIIRGEEEEKSRLQKRNEEDASNSDGLDSDLESHFDEMYKEVEEKWDCETIISTYSNLENHPSIVDAPSGAKRRASNSQKAVRLDSRTQIPAEPVSSGNAVRVGFQGPSFGSQRQQTAEIARDKGESKEHKKARKAAVRERARERRALKSEMRKAFGAETTKQKKHAAALGSTKVAMQL